MSHYSPIQTGRSISLLLLVFLFAHDQWETLQEDNFIPKTKRTVEKYPRNGILMCKSHHALFDSFFFFIRYDITVMPLP
jgi:HNH endonuclease